MSEYTGISLPEPGTLRAVPPPHGRGLPGLVPITLTFALAVLLVAGSGLVLFGWYAFRVLAISVAVSLLAESVFNAVKGRSPSWSESHALLLGVLFGCTLPATAPWRVVVVGALITIVLGEALSGGIGNYLWHPVALGRVAVQVLFAQELTPERWPVLAPGRLLTGSLDRASELTPLHTWGSHVVPAGVDAWLVTPTDDLLRNVLPNAGSDAASALTGFIRDLAPPWFSTLTGVAGGGIGEACTAVVLMAGCVLLWRGFLRGSMLMAAVAAAMAVAIVLPIRTAGPDGAIVSCSLPGFVVREGLPVGAAYVLYQLTAGGFPLVLILLASDPSSSPLTTRGHTFFGLMIGALTILLRVGTGVPAAAYWALMAANTCVPAINRFTRRRVLGT